jgi:hypothetical protein
MAFLRHDAQTCLTGVPERLGHAQLATALLLRSAGGVLRIPVFLSPQFVQSKQRCSSRPEAHDELADIDKTRQ